MKYTAFIDFHQKLGAKMVPFAGYLMPVEYAGITVEHKNVREKLGVFDVSHMGEIWVKGPKALSYLQRITTNDVSVLSDGKVQYTCFPTISTINIRIISKSAIYLFPERKRWNCGRSPCLQNKC